MEKGGRDGEAAPRPQEGTDGGCEALGSLNMADVDRKVAGAEAGGMPGPLALLWTLNVNEHEKMME